MGRMNLARAWLAVLLLTFVSGCGFFGRHPQEFHGGSQEGVASWYGPGFHGKQTASGAIYNQYDLTAAHQTLPLGTRVLVTNKRNGKQVEVTVTDRGPFVGDRIIDLSYAAARSIDMVGPGTAPVRIEAVLAEQPLTRVRYSVQVGAFVDPGTAQNLKRKLEDDFDNVHVTTVPGENGNYYRVRIGRFHQREQATVLARNVAADGMVAIVVEDSGRE